MPGKTLSFASFELNLEQRELRRAGTRVPLQHKPFRILELLLREPGSLVTRKELARELWPGLHVNYDHSLNSAVNTLRQVLGDSPRESNFIETRSGLGYRFIAPVEVAGTSATASIHVPPDCLRGRFFLDKMRADSIHRAIGCFQSALKEEPNCLAAYTGLADAYSHLALSGTVSASDLCQRSREVVAKALSLSPLSAETHVAVSRLRMVFDWDWSGAAAALKQAEGVQPGLPEARRTRALLLAAQQRHGEALEEMVPLHESDPLSFPIAHELAWLLYLSKDFEQAGAKAWMLLSLDAGFAPAQTILGLCHQQLGVFDEAITELENACVCSDRQPSALSALGHACGAAGLHDRAIQVLQELRSISERRYVSHYWYALVECSLGRHSQASQELDSACAQRDPLLLWLNVDHRFAPLKTDTVFRSVVRRVGLQCEA